MERDRELAARAKAAADFLFNAPGETCDIFEPSDARTAEAAIRRFAMLYHELPGLAKTVMTSSQSSGEMVSSDPLQGLAEIVQNADDVEATEVRLLLEPTALLVSHNGNPVRLPHVLALATPWLTTKAGQAALMGRFGIGLTTLRTLSETLEVHCDPYHVRLGDPFLSAIQPPRMPPGFDKAAWTTFRVPLAEGKVSPKELSAWLDRWDDSAMLFLRTVSKIALRTRRGDTIRKLAISREERPKVSLGLTSAVGGVSCERVTAHDGRSWMVHRAEFPKPEGVDRAHKATESTTPVGIALPLHHVEAGKIHAGLPVAPTRMAVFANAQFDPTTSRQEFPDNEWNKALVPLVAELWSAAVLDAFDRDPRSAWHAIPIGDGSDERSQMPVVRRLEAQVISSARQRVAPRLRLPIARKGRLPLRVLAVEERPLEGILTAEETTELAGLDATVPVEVRDVDGTWREVLEDWREAGVTLPPPVTVEQALALLKNEARPPKDVIALCAVALDERLGNRLLQLPCVVARDGRRLVPPLQDAPEVVALDLSPLAQQLGVVTLLHPAHLDDEPGPRRVLEWLKECGALVNGMDDRQVVHRLAVAGRSHRHVPRPLPVEGLQALRAVFEQLEQEERERLGPDVGRAVEFEAYEWELRGRKRRRRTITAAAAHAYLPAAIDREDRGFAAAADKTPGLLWISGRYVRHLRSSHGRQGVGAQRFLRLLGAETAPRIRPHPELDRTYVADSRRGLGASIPGGAPARAEQLAERGGTHTLEDRDSPALAAVIEDIARVRSGRQRRNRAAALVSSLARAWDRLGDYSEVQSAYGYHGWKDSGPMPAYWLWQARDVPWLDDERGKPRRPSELRVRTDGTLAVYGTDPSNYLHADLFSQSWQPVLSALGVSGEPSRRQLVARLKKLRAAMQAGEYSQQDAAKETAIVYKALARSLQGASSRSDLSRANLRQEFSRGDGLILTQSGWHTPGRVLRGDPILGPYRPFAPAVADTTALWQALELDPPSVMDCVKVIRKIAQHFPVNSRDTVILLEALRAIAGERNPHATSRERRALRELPLLTRRGWVRQRPVYATDDPLLADSLGDRVPIWQPGGDLEQFSSILDPLQVRPIGASAQVIDPEVADESHDFTQLFHAAVQQLREDLVRNDPDLALGLLLPWERLEVFSVHVHPSLALRVPAEDSNDELFECTVAVRVDPNRGVVFVRRARDLASVDRGGRALAMLFKGDGRRLAQAWRGAWDRAEEGRPATLLELAQERAAKEEREKEVDITERMEAFREDTSHRHRTGRRTAEGQRGPGKAQSHGGQRSGTGAMDPATSTVPRQLVDPSTLRLLDPEGRITERTNSSKRRVKSRDGLLEPRGPAPPRSRTPPPNYTSEQRERVGLELLEMVLASDLLDVRAKRRVGADAVDEQKRYFELKVSAGGEPDVVTLTAAEVMRAATDPNFTLVVVSGVEGGHARPTVRLFLEPLKQLHLGSDEGSISLSGVRTVTEPCL